MVMVIEKPLEALVAKIPHRATQVTQLHLLLNSSYAPKNLVVHGVEATGKSFTIQHVLQHSTRPCAIVRSAECITTRHLLERTLLQVVTSMQARPTNAPLPEVDLRCENLSAFVVTLQTLLRDVDPDDRFVLVFDGIDRQREASAMLIPALARLGELIPRLTVVFVMTRPSPSALRQVAIPHIHFPPYVRHEIIAITAASDFPLQNSPTEESSDEVQALWIQFITAVWDSLGQAAASDLPSFQRLCERLWPRFVQPVTDGEVGLKDFSKLLVRNRGLLQDESAVTSSIVAQQSTEPSRKSLSLPHFSSHLLLAAYLASYVSPRHDITLFSKASLAKQRKRGGATVNRTSKSKHAIPRRLQGASTFPMERLLSIFYAIIAVEDGRIVRSGSADILGQYAILAGLRLVVKGGAAGGGDVLDPATKWRVNVSYETIRDVATGVEFDVDEYLIE